MELKQLEYFLEVAHTKSFTRSAENLFVTQPMLTKVVKQLETELGVRLIERTSKFFRLTDAGEKLMNSATALIDQYRNLLASVQDIELLKEGEVSISIPATVLSLYFPNFLLRLREKYPGIHITIFEEGSYTAVSSVLSDAVDMGVVMLPVNDTRLNVRTVVRDRCVAVVSCKHPLAGEKYIDIAELKEELFIVFNKNFVLYNVFLEICHTMGFHPNIIYQSSMDSFILDMVALNQGISILPRPLAVRKKMDDCVCIDLNQDIPWEIAFITKQGRYQTFAARELIRSAYDYFDTNCL